MSTAEPTSPQIGTASLVEQASLQEHGLYDRTRERDACGLG